MICATNRPDVLDPGERRGVSLPKTLQSRNDNELVSTLLDLMYWCTAAVTLLSDFYFITDLSL